MYNLNQHLHFVGIGGVGMAGIAEILLNLGYSVSGSDLKSTKLTQRLERLGAQVCLGHAAENLPPKTSVVVISSAVGPDNPEVVRARESHVPVIARAEMLAELMRMKYGITVAGSHGKTTTTSMIAKILSDAGLDPTVVIGGRVLSQESGARLGTGQYLVAESDESDGSFCLLKPAIAVVTNIDREHLGHYGSFGALEAAFQHFMSSVPFYGLVVACVDDPVVSRLADNLQRRVCRYGFGPGADISAQDIVFGGGRSTYRLVIGGENRGQVSLPLSGVHMVSNSLAAIAIGLEVGVYVEEIVASLQTFPGVSRRAEVVFQDERLLVIDDYAHHPTEIAATLRALRNGFVKAPVPAQESGLPERGKLIALFQPHRPSRVRELFSDFVSCFQDADQVIVSDIYAAGEDEIEGISGQSLASAIRHERVSYIPDLLSDIDRFKASLVPGDVVVTLGAGSITQVAHRLADQLKADNDSPNR